MSLLDDLANKYGTEKGSKTAGCFHNYCPFYETFISHLRHEKIRLLEFGVDKGNSLRMWAEYFPNGKIIGVDVNDTSVCNTDQITTVVGNQASLDDLQSINTLYGPFDIIVDDAGHAPEHQLICYQNMIGRLGPGGVYILEDLVNHDGPPEDARMRDYLFKVAYDALTKKGYKIEIAFSYGTTVTRLI